MKKNIIFIIMLLSLSMLFLFGCNKSSNREDIIDGVANINISADILEYDFAQNITATSSLNVDSSKVCLGTPGKYDIYYTSGNTTVKAVVRVFGNMNIAYRDVQLTYSEAIVGSLEGIIAKDYFGNDAEISYIGVDNLLYFESGKTYRAKYLIKDIVGNEQIIERNITITNVKEYNFSQLTVDASNYILAIDLLGDEFIGYIANNKLYSDLVFSDGKISGLNKLYSLLGQGKKKITIVTNKGYSNINITLVDNEEVKYEFDSYDKQKGIDNYIFAKGDVVNFPSIIAQTNCYQNFEVNYSLKKDGNEISLGSFDSNECGEYEITSTIKKANKKDIINKQVFYIVSDKEKTNYLFSTESNQFLNNYLPDYSVGANVQYVGLVSDNKGNSYNAIKYTTKEENSSASNEVLSLDIKALEDILSTGTRTLTLKMMMVNDYDEVFNTFIYSYNGEWNCSNNEQFVLKQGVWTEITLNLDSCWARKGVPDLYSLDFFGNAKINYSTVGFITRCHNTTRKYFSIYIADVKFGTEYKDASTTDFYNFTNDNLISLNGRKELTSNIDGEKISYSNIFVYENGLVKLVENDQDVKAAKILADINGNELLFNGQSYNSFNVGYGNIYSVGNISLDNYGYSLKKIGCSISYEVYNARTEQVVSGLDSNTFKIEINDEGGYYLQLKVEKNNETKYFKKYFYVAKDSYVSKLESEYLFYAGVDVNNNDIFAIATDINAYGHHIVTIDSSIINKMLDDGKTEIEIAVNCKNDTGDEQLFRYVGDNFTYSGGTDILVPFEDYWNIESYNIIITIKIGINESMRGKNVGFSSMRNIEFQFVNIN